MRPAAKSSLFVALLVALTNVAVAADGTIEVEPREGKLIGKFARLQLRVTRQSADTADIVPTVDATREAVYSTPTPAILSVSITGQVTPLAAGQGSVHVRLKSAQGEAAQFDVPVEVSGMTAEPNVSFRHDVIAMFNRAGCNQGACHAAQYGQGGFKLSLLGYAPEEDYPQLTRDFLQRRITPLAPADSLFLLKGTMTTAHRGGRRLEPSSYEYELLKAWVAAGAPGPVAAEADVVELNVVPREHVYRVGQKQQLRVTARLADGTIQDVTHRVKYDSLGDGVAKVEPSGYVSAVGHGQAGVMIRYLGQVGLSLAVVPYRDHVDLANFQPLGEIDELVVARWKRLGLEPSAVCDDEQFIRRAYLDAIGTLPKVERIEAFAASTDPNKRATLVDELLGLTGDPNRDIFVNDWSSYWALKWGDLLLNTSTKMGAGGTWAFNNWLRQSLRENKPMDRFAREIITAEGSTRDVGPANYYLTSRDPVDMVETTAQVFLGVRLQCAKCHNHPFEIYTQRDYYGLAAFFTRIGMKKVADFGTQQGGVNAVRVLETGTIRHPRTAEVMKPTPLRAAPIDDAAVRDPRRLLAQWIVAKENPFFARNIANRTWGYLMGTGLVEPVDDMRATNPPSNPELFDRLAERFVEDGYDLRKLMRRIMTSRVYQLSSAPMKDEAADARYYTHYNVKRLPAEVLLDAIDFACGTREKFAGVPLGTRAIELPDPTYESYFLDTMGRPVRASACECERSAAPNLAQALQIANGDLINRKLTDKANRLTKLLEAKATPEQAVAELYLATVSRKPTAQEHAESLKIMERAPTEREGLEDLLWALCNSQEFFFNH